MFFIADRTQYEKDKQLELVICLMATVSLSPSPLPYSNCLSLTLYLSLSFSLSSSSSIVFLSFTLPLLSPFSFWSSFPFSSPSSPLSLSTLLSLSGSQGGEHYWLHLLCRHGFCGVVWWGTACVCARLCVCVCN